MSGFYTMLKKEVKELLTLQMIVPMLVSILALALIGGVVGSESKKAQSNQEIAFLDLDKSEASNEVTDLLVNAGFNISRYEDKTVEELLNELKGTKASTILTIPEGFEEGLDNFKQQTFNRYNIIKSFSMFSSASGQVVDIAMSAVNDYLSSKLIVQANIPHDPSAIKNPIIPNDFVVINESTANIGMEQVMGFISSQSLIIPIVIFLIIMMSSQMIAVTIASEKENKTLETLLSTPVSRISLVTAKMSAAGFVSLLMAVAYMVGMSYYFKGLMGDAFSSEGGSAIGDAMAKLGLTLGFSDYLLIGATLFLSILISLAVSLILGAFAEDVKKAQSLIMPVTFLVMIPYMLTMFIDVSTVSAGLKLLVYIIPFSHSFTASNNLFLQNTAPVIYGIIYQAVVLVVLIVAAGRIFKSDKILTMKLSMPKRGRKSPKHSEGANA
ncbi:MAG: ABC transporter permease [Eubacteriales bacterium]|nr:ABC transporter permease [Eubacteriales bacterium]